jgi:hypothetical protein
MPNVRVIMDAYYPYAMFLFLDAFRAAMHFPCLRKVRYGTCRSEHGRKNLSSFPF